MTVLAAQRDASWFGHPDIYTVKRYHIAIPDGQRRRTGEQLYSAACNRESRPLCEFATVPAPSVAPGLRCQANGCRQAWEKLTA